MHTAGMSRLDVAREKIAYLKLGLGVVVATEIGLMSWLLTSVGPTPAWKFWAAVVAVVIIAPVVFAAHRQIMRRINDLEEL